MYIYFFFLFIYVYVYIYIYIYVGGARWRKGLRPRDPMWVRAPVCT